MLNYTLRRLVQGLPQLVIISVVLFVLMQNMGDPIATLGGRIPVRQEEKERLRRMWGLDQPTLADALARQVEHPSFHRWMGSEDAREGPKAFAEKRPQQWKGR